MTRLALLVGAGVAGAVVENKAVVIKQKEWARAGTSRLYCRAYFDQRMQRRAFDCGLWAGKRHLPRSFRAAVGPLGVDVYRLDAAGRTSKKVASWRNP